jgi:hypothetical protein
MEELKLAGSFNFPSIDFNPDTGALKIIGRSIPENPVKFYLPIENWIREYIQLKPKDITLFIHLDYLNTHSTECILILMKKLQEYYQESGANVKVIWNFEDDDEDMKLLGEDLASLVKLPFAFFWI